MRIITARQSLQDKDVVRLLIERWIV